MFKTTDGYDRTHTDVHSFRRPRSSCDDTLLRRVYCRTGNGAQGPQAGIQSGPQEPKGHQTSSGRRNGEGSRRARKRIHTYLRHARSATFFPQTQRAHKDTDTTTTALPRPARLYRTIARRAAQGSGRKDTSPASPRGQCARAKGLTKGIRILPHMRHAPPWARAGGICPTRDNGQVLLNRPSGS